MQGTGLHLASRCEKMQVPEQFQATDALKKSSKAPQNYIFGCTIVMLSCHMSPVMCMLVWIEAYVNLVVCCV